MNHPDLFALLRGELTNAEATAARPHLVTCSECRAELAELAVGNALLSRAVRTLTGPGSTAPSSPDLPPLRPVAGRRGRTWWAVTGAVAAGVALGAVGVALLGDSSDDEASVPSAYASVALGPVDGKATGEVRMVDEGRHQTRMTIAAPDLPGAGSGHFYYAWLLDPDTNKMLPLGQVGPNGVASFDLDNALLGSYTAIDVSLEDDDGDPGHSVTSVLRGTYADPAPSSAS